MVVRIKAVAFANGKPCPVAGQYLKSFDFDAYNGQGFGEFTGNKEDALTFASPVEAFNFWNTQSTVKPRRDSDGRQNRPLTSTTIELEVN